MGVVAQHMIGQSGRQINLNLENLAARAAPVIFVVLWSTGFVATKYVLHNAEPLTYLTIRMAVVIGLMAVIVAIARPQWPDGMGIAHSVVDWCMDFIWAGLLSPSRIRSPPGFRR